MAEESIVRILFQEEGVTLATAREGLVLILGESQESARTLPWRWDDVLDILPTLHGKVVWQDMCKNCGDQIEDLHGVTIHTWAKGVFPDAAEDNCRGCLVESWREFHGEMPLGELESVAERA